MTNEGKQLMGKLLKRTPIYLKQGYLKEDVNSGTIISLINSKLKELNFKPLTGNLDNYKERGKITQSGSIKPESLGILKALFKTINYEVSVAWAPRQDDPRVFNISIRVRYEYTHNNFGSNGHTDDYYFNSKRGVWDH